MIIKSNTTIENLKQLKIKKVVKIRLRILTKLESTTRQEWKLTKSTSHLRLRGNSQL